MITVSNPHWVLHYWTATRCTFQPPFTTEPVSIELRNYAPYKIKNVVKTDKDKQRFKTLWERRLKDAAVAQAELEEYEA